MKTIRIAIILGMVINCFLMPAQAKRAVIKNGVGSNPTLIIVVGGLLDNTDHKIMRNFANHIAGKPEYRETLIWYMEHDHHSHVVQEMSSHRCKYPESNIILIGHSLGGDTVIDVRDDRGVGNINLVITLDGVDAGLRVGSTKKYAIQRWVNLYTKNGGRTGINFRALGAWWSESGANYDKDVSYVNINDKLRHVFHEDADIMYSTVEKKEVFPLLAGSPDQFRNSLLDTDISAAMVHPNSRTYFFRDSSYQRYDHGLHKIDKTGLMGNAWSGVWTSGIDAAVGHRSGNTFLFKGNEYKRYNHSTHKVDKTGKIGIDGWKGVFPSGIDAAVRHPNGKTYFFSGNKYKRYNHKKHRVDKTGELGAAWHGVWTSGIDAAVSHYSGDTFFFKGDQYKRYDHDTHKVIKTGTIGENGWKCL